MRATYRVLAYAIAVGVVLQAAAIAFAWFGVLNEVDGGGVFDASHEGNLGHLAHGTVGMTVMPVLALALLVVSFFAKVPGGVKWAAIVLGAVVLQIALAFVSFGSPAIGALHGINAFVVLATADLAARRAKPDATARIPAARAAESGHARGRRRRDLNVR